MKKIILLILTLNALLFAEHLPFTLENLKNLNIYYVDKSGLFTKQEQNSIKKNIENKLIKTGFNTHGSDPSTLVIIVQTIDIDDIYVANISLLVGEEVITKRKDAIATMAFTYHVNDFVELDEPVDDIEESINTLLDEFINLYREDME